MIIVIISLASLAAAFWFLSSFLIWYTQDKSIFPGDGVVFGAHPEIQALGGTVESGERDGQQLRWYEFRPLKPRAVLLLFHGNREGAYERRDYASQLVPAGVAVVLAEYPGYGGDKSPTGEWPILRNALAAYDEIEARNPGLPLFVMGESMGTGPAAYVSSLRRPKGLLLSTPYTSMADVAKHRYPWVPIHGLIRHPLKEELWAPHVQAPVLILHGTLDKTVPYAMGQAVSKRFKNLEKFVTIEAAGHSNLRDLGAGLFWSSCREFIANHE